MSVRTFSILLVLLFSGMLVQAQSPQRFSYQAVLRDNANQPLSNKAVRLRVSILTDSLSGPSAYTETHQVTTGATGILQIAIGGGTVVSGSFAAVPWAGGRLFVRTETDPTGGTNYTLSTTSQLLSVPYSMYTSDVPVSKSGDTVTIGSARLVIPGSVLIPGNMPATIQDGLVAYYPFTGNAGDSSGKGNHGTVNGATLTVDRNGKAASAYLFNGVNQNIRIPPVTKSLPTFTISFWFRLLDWQSACSDGRYFFSMNSTPSGTTAVGDEMNIGRHPMTGTNNLLFGIFDMNPGGGWRWVNSGIQPASTRFYHLVASANGSVMRLYIDGSLIGSLPYTKPLTQFTNACTIGSSSYSCSYVNAVIDEFRVHSRALTDAEIRYLYEN